MLKWELSIYYIVDVLYCTLFLIYCSLKCANGAVHVTRVWLKMGFWSGFALEIKWQPINYTQLLTSHTVNCIGKLTNLVSNKNKRLVFFYESPCFAIIKLFLSITFFFSVVTDFLTKWFYVLHWLHIWHLWLSHGVTSYILIWFCVALYLIVIFIYVFYLTIWLSHLVSISVTLQ